MPTPVRNLSSAKIDRILAVQNQQRSDILRMRAGLVFHADASTAISAADATTVPTVIALANAIRASYVLHIASVVSATTGQGAHIAADETNVLVAPVATDQDTANTLLNDVKAKYNAHRVLTSSHPVADATNAIAAADATDAASSYTLANELKADLNLHYAGALGATATLVVPA
jgi:hypothetical protein